MNILHYANYGSPYEGNFIQSLMQLREEVLSRGDSFQLVLQERAKSATWPQKLMRKGVRISFINSDTIACAMKLRRLIIDEKIDIVHVHFVNLRILLIFELALLGMKKVQYYIHLHNHVSRNGVTIRKMLMKKAEMLCCSYSVAEGVSAIGIPKQNIHVVENAICFERLEENNEKFDLNNLFDTPKYRLLMFGFDYERKGVDVVLDAIDKMESGSEKVQLFISVSSNLQYVKDKITQRYGKLPEWISLLPPCNEIGTYYRQVDAFISASREEGFCYALIEAAYCQKTIIASKIPAQKDLELPAARWFSNEDSDELAHILDELVSSRGEDESALKNQKKIVVNHYNLEAWAKKIADCYHREGENTN